MSRITEIETLLSASPDDELLARIARDEYIAEGWTGKLARKRIWFVRRSAARARDLAHCQRLIAPGSLWQEDVLYAIAAFLRGDHPPRFELILCEGFYLPHSTWTHGTPPRCYLSIPPYTRVTCGASWLVRQLEHREVPQASGAATDDSTV